MYVRSCFWDGRVGGVLRIIPPSVRLDSKEIAVAYQRQCVMYLLGKCTGV